MTIVELTSNPEIDKLIKIYALQTNPMRPGYLFLGTTHGLYVMGFERQAVPNFAFNYFFSSYLTLSQAREFISSADGARRPLNTLLLDKLKNLERIGQSNDGCPSFLYLAGQKAALSCNLLELERRADGAVGFQSLSAQLYKHALGSSLDDCQVKCSLSGRFVSFFNRSNGFFEVLLVDNSHLYG